MHGFTQFFARPVGGTALAILVSFGNRGVQAQFGDFVVVGRTSLDTPVDPVSISMGESMVALRGNSNAMMYNPAGLARSRGVSASYSQRRLNWNPDLDDLKYHQGVATVASPIGSFGVMYSRFDMGEVIYTTEQSPDGIGGLRAFNETVALGYGLTLGGYGDIGLTLKTFSMTQKDVGPPTGIIEEQTRPYLFDIGVTFGMNNVLTADRSTDELSFGMSLQNFGTDFKLKTTYTNLFPMPPGTTTREQTVPLPRYLRMGFAYSLSINPREEGGLSPVQILITGEYRNLLNPGRYQEDKSDYWGFGFEASVYKVVSARIGGFITPANSIYGDRGVPQLRYGFGLRAPLQQLGIAAPFTINVDYSGIPITVSSYWTNVNTTLKAFSLQITYEGDFF